MMKAKDLSTATALLIQGYLAANDAIGGTSHKDRMELAKAISAIRQECSDWAENLDDDVVAVTTAARGAL